MTGKRRPRASTWQETATEITAQKARGPQYLSLTDVCDRTGLKASAVMSYVNRTGETRSEVPMAHLTRPAYKVGAAPFWSQAQVDDYFQAQADRKKARAERLGDLPEVTSAEAERLELWSLRRLAGWAGFAVVTFHRMANQEGFPQPAAAMSSGGPNPFFLRSRPEVEKWLRANKPGWNPGKDPGRDPAPTKRSRAKSAPKTPKK